MSKAISVMTEEKTKEILSWLEENTSIKWRNGKKPTDSPAMVRKYDIVALAIDYFEPEEGLSSWSMNSSSISESTAVVNLDTFKAEAVKRYPKEGVKVKTPRR